MLEIFTDLHKETHVIEYALSDWQTLSLNDVPTSFFTDFGKLGPVRVEKTSIARDQG
jgi:hypothetical protein